MLNLLAHSPRNFREFRSQKSNWIDMFIVIVSLVNLAIFTAGSDIPNTKLLRLLRLGRVVRLSLPPSLPPSLSTSLPTSLPHSLMLQVRLFRSLKDLHKLLSAISSAVYPVMNAFVILFIVAAVYAVVGTHYFKEDYPEYFANFSTSLFTMFQVLSGDSWASSVARSMFLKRNPPEMGTTQADIAIFFVSYVLIASIMLLNVVVAVLLDEFISTVTRAKEAEASAAAVEMEKRKVAGCLDPITRELITFDDDEGRKATTWLQSTFLGSSDASLAAANQLSQTRVGRMNPAHEDKSAVYTKTKVQFIGFGQCRLGLTNLLLD